MWSVMLQTIVAQDRGCHVAHDWRAGIMFWRGNNYNVWCAAEWNWPHLHWWGKMSELPWPAHGILVRLVKGIRLEVRVLACASTTWPRALWVIPPPPHPPLPSSLLSSPPPPPSTLHTQHVFYFVSLPFPPIMILHLRYIFRSLVIATHDRSLLRRDEEEEEGILWDYESASKKGEMEAVRRTGVWPGQQGDHGLHRGLFCWTPCPSFFSTFILNFNGFLWLVRWFTEEKIWFQYSLVRIFLFLWLLLTSYCCLCITPFVCFSYIFSSYPSWSPPPFLPLLVNIGVTIMGLGILVIGTIALLPAQ